MKKTVIKKVLIVAMAMLLLLPVLSSIAFAQQGTVVFETDGGTPLDSVSTSQLEKI